MEECHRLAWQVVSCDPGGDFPHEIDNHQRQHNIQTGKIGSKITRTEEEYSVLPSRGGVFGSLLKDRAPFLFKDDRLLGAVLVEWSRPTTTSSESSLRHEKLNSFKKFPLE